ncbi:MAG: Asp-tRNA(Asn)/Glu-tRNA(Gln) amidotransferase subunit GatC [Armatimonadetes bacterium]|nr:Asp-tRNA(Asn)/Glu-tRNA(Gln) amidotransferase subunit GatC [Anaerolineae bacterium]
MELSHSTVRSIAELAKLHLSDDEVALYAGQLSKILGYFEHLQALDTSHLAATASVLPLSNVLRPDVVLPPLSPEQAVANAADSEDNQFRVRAVLAE